MNSCQVDSSAESPVVLTAIRCLLVTLVLLAACLAGTGPAQSCTLWAAAGDNVTGGGTLIAKNRDWRPNHQQALKLIEPEDGYRHFALLRDEGEPRNVKAGVNEMGLVVVSASSPFTRKERREMPRTAALNRKLLVNCASVEEALKRHYWFLGPRFLMLSDRREIALVEIGPKAEVTIRQKRHGVLYHTNHYITGSLESFNADRPYESSLARFKRIGRFMRSKPAFSLQDFLLISSSKDGGPDNSIWRDGGSPRSRRTLASWIVHLLPRGDFRLRVTLANPGKEVIHRTYSRKDLFEYSD